MLSAVTRLLYNTPWVGKINACNAIQHCLNIKYHLVNIRSHSALNCLFKQLNPAVNHAKILLTLYRCLCVIRNVLAHLPKYKPTHLLLLSYWKCLRINFVLLLGSCNNTCTRRQQRMHMCYISAFVHKCVTEINNTHDMLWSFSHNCKILWFCRERQRNVVAAILWFYKKKLQFINKGNLLLLPYCIGLEVSEYHFQ